MSDTIARKAAEWTVRPVHKQDGKEWPGLGYISDGNQTYGAVNIEQAKVIAAAHNSSIQSAIEEAFDAGWDKRDLVAKHLEQSDTKRLEALIRDSDPKWYLKAIELTRALKKAKNVIDTAMKENL